MKIKIVKGAHKLIIKHNNSPPTLKKSMDIKDFTEIYYLISTGMQNVSSRKDTAKLRKDAIKSIASTGMVKLAFDTRRVNQETDYIPRRGLQNYHRSEAFLSEATSDKIQNFAKLKRGLEELKTKLGKQPEWQDSYARILLSTIDRAIRTDQQDGDYAESQPGVGSLDYLEELLYTRYRLDMNSIASKSEEELNKIILAKDESLTNRDKNSTEITKRDVATQSYDSLLDKLFGGVKATKDNPEVERTVTITIKDKFVEQK